MRVLAGVYIVGGVATLLAPEVMGRFTRWFGNHPRLMRLDAVLIMALGALLALRESGGKASAPVVATVARRLKKPRSQAQLGETYY